MRVAEQFAEGGPVWGGPAVRFVPWTSAEEVDEGSLHVTADECLLGQRGACIRDHGHPDAVASLRPPRTNGCWDCGRTWAQPGWVDAWIPDDLWKRISPLPDGGGHLCVHCITDALTRLGATDVPVELWAPPFRRGGYVHPSTEGSA